MPTRTTNIWVAAGEGHLDRVIELVEIEDISPNAADSNTYTPMHAAASYGHIHILEYLVAKGGDVNIKDNDDETPLFVVESIELARWLVERGVDINCKNKEGYTAAQNLAEEFPEVATYLQSLNPSAPSIHVTAQLPSQYMAEQAVSSLVDSMMENSEVLIQRAEAEGRDAEEELRDLVGRAVLDSILTGAALAKNNQPESSNIVNGESITKRAKYDPA